MKDYIFEIINADDLATQFILYALLLCFLSLGFLPQGCGVFGLIDLAVWSQQIQRSCFPPLSCIQTRPYIVRSLSLQYQDYPLMIDLFGALIKWID